mgnify:CR=1 FL=1
MALGLTRAIDIPLSTISVYGISVMFFDTNHLFFKTPDEIIKDAHGYELIDDFHDLFDLGDIDLFLQAFVFRDLYRESMG